MVPSNVYLPSFQYFLGLLSNTLIVIMAVIYMLFNSAWTTVRGKTSGLGLREEFTLLLCY